MKFADKKQVDMIVSLDTRNGYVRPVRKSMTTIYNKIRENMILIMQNCESINNSINNDFARYRYFSNGIYEIKMMVISASAAQRLYLYA
jgi:hypothetical protein